MTAGGALAFAPLGAKSQPRRVPFEHARGKIFAPAMVNGQPVQALLDSGSAVLGIDEGFAAEAGVPATGRRARMRGLQNTLAGRFGRIGRLSAGGRELRDLSVFVTNYESLAVTIGRPVEMILGVEFFRRFVVELDFRAQEFALHDRAAFTPPADAVTVPLGSHGSLVTAPVGLAGGGSVQALLDTGSDPALILSPRVADRHGLFRGRVSTTPLGGIGGPTIARITSAPALTFGGVTFTEVPVFAPPRPLGVDANLGLELLGRFHVWLDVQGRKLWLKPGGEPGPFPRDLLGVFGEVEGERIRVFHVAAGSPADRAGFRAGEVIVAINGEPAGVANRALATAGEGTALTFLLEGGRTRSLTLTRYF